MIKRRAAAAGTGIETVGNRLPDPAILFLLLLVLTWIASAVLAPVEFAEIDPRACEPVELADYYPRGYRASVSRSASSTSSRAPALATFLVQLVPTFTGFAPLGVVLVALLGVGWPRRPASSTPASSSSWAGRRRAC